ncbi:MAG: ribosome maturation factor RimP [Lachnospiraceae bacterium]|nr:ribosome maturation factor RimP [Lachnospiraceae bacterium]
MIVEWTRVRSIDFIEGIIVTGAKLYEARTEEILAPFLAERKLDLFDVEFVKEGSERYLRAYIDKDGGVTIDDCETVSRFLSDELDKEDFIPEAYILEVSSPGLGRQLKKDRHLEKSLGKDVDVKLFAAVNGEKEFSGTLERFDKDVLVLGMEDGTDMNIDRKNIVLIKLAFDF